MTSSALMRPFLIGLIAVSAVFWPVFALAQPGAALQAPVTISDCRGGIASIELMEVAAYDVTLRNDASAAADEIALSVRTHRNKLIRFQLRGTFTPAVVIKRRVGKTIGVGLYSYSSAHNDCYIDSVHFVNGTSWNRR